MKHLNEKGEGFYKLVDTEKVLKHLDAIKSDARSLKAIAKTTEDKEFFLAQEKLAFSLSAQILRGDFDYLVSIEKIEAGAFDDKHRTIDEFVELSIEQCERLKTLYEEYPQNTSSDSKLRNIAALTAFKQVQQHIERLNAARD